MTKVVVEPSSLRRGAHSCADASREASAAATRLRSLSPPPGTPGLVGPQVADATRHLGWAADSIGRQTAFLTSRAKMALAADGPFGADLDLGMPTLSDPWSAPPKIEKPKKHHSLLGSVAHGLGDFGKGFGGGMIGSTKTALALSGAAAAHVMDGDVGVLPPGVMLYLHHRGLPRLSDQIPGLGKLRRRVDDNVVAGVTHPKRTLSDMGRGMIDYDDWSHGRIMKALGNNTFTVLTIADANPAGTAGDAARGVRAVGDARHAMTVTSVKEIHAMQRMRALRAERESAERAPSPLRGQRASTERVEQLRRTQNELDQLAERRNALEAESTRAQQRLQYDVEDLRKFATGQAKGAVKSYVVTDHHDRR